MDYKKQLDELGYVVLPNLILPEACDQYKVLLEQNFQQYSSSYIGVGNITSHGLNDKSYEKGDELDRRWMENSGISYVIPFKKRGKKSFFWKKSRFSI